MLRNKYVAIGVGILLILVIVHNVKFFSTRGISSQMAASADRDSGKTPLSAKMTITERTIEQEDENRWKRDPFGLKIRHTRTKHVKQPDFKGIQLMGIIKRDDRSHALINGKVYSVNDRVGNAVIKEIKKHSIVLLINGSSREISF